MDQEGKNDLESVRRVQAGETEAFEPLVRRHEKKIFNLLYRWLGDYDEAAEAAQEVFLSAYRAIHRFRGESSFSTWLYRIAVNHAKNRWKSRRGAERFMAPISDAELNGDGGPVVNFPDPAPDPAQTVERRELEKQVQRGLNTLHSDEALVILLHDLQDFSYEEISGLLDIPLGTVKSRLHRARLALKAKLAPYRNSIKARE